jgi:peptidoglycan/xylan/chitin deacetylase (PgdA/CDA1 family)
MRSLWGLIASIALTLFSSASVFAQGRRVAITVDDLPYAGETSSPENVSRDASAAVTVNRKLLSAFVTHHVPVTGFVIQKVVESFGAPGMLILREWIRQGFDLGNHTYSHSDFNTLSPQQFEEEIARGEAGFGPLLREAGKRPAFFRFPFNHTGDTQAKKDLIAAFLSQRGYRLATCTIDNSDYVFNHAYLLMIAKSDDAAAQKLRLAYLAYTDSEIKYYAALNKQVFGYEPPQVMLLHDNRLNADLIDQVLQLFEAQHYRFVSLGEAQSDTAYQTPDTYVTKYGPMWGYRWAKERNVKVDGRLEPDPPQWIVNYAESTPQSSP